MLPKAEEIQQLESKPMPLPIEPWVAAHLSRLWQGMKKNIQISIAVDKQAKGRTLSGALSSADKQEQLRSAQSKPASSHNLS